MPVKKHEKTPELVDEILAQMVEGKSLTAICKQKGMPSVGTVYRWMAEDEVLSEGYARATQARARSYAERMEDVVNQALNGEIRSDAARVAVDAYKFITTRLMPQLYGDRQTVDVNVQHTHSLHHEALKRLTERASGTDRGYIDADYQEIPRETKALSKGDTIDDILRASDPEPKPQGNPGSQGSEGLETPRGVDHPEGAATMATPAPSTQSPRKKPPTPRTGGKRKASTK
jgi:hypothetical protein